MIRYYTDLQQGSDAWISARCGLITASEMGLILTPKTMKVADNDKVRSHVFEMAAQRISKYVEPRYIGDDMLRGQVDEIEARAIYAEHYGEVQEVGFITNDKWGFTLGYSPDALVGDDGLVECKSRRQKFQIETIVSGEMPAEFALQVQTGLMVSERKWVDFVSYSGGLPMMTVRVFPDEAMQAAIVGAAQSFEAKVAEKVAAYNGALASTARLIPTERKIIQEMYI